MAKALSFYDARRLIRSLFPDQRIDLKQEGKDFLVYFGESFEPKFSGNSWEEILALVQEEKFTKQNK